MLTALDAPEEALDEGERTFVAKVREHGWFRTGVSADDDGPGFSYTTGFWVHMRQPELILFGLKDEIVHDVLWELFRDAGAGRVLPIASRTMAVFANAPAYVFPVAKRHYADYLGWSSWFYGGDDFPCLQIVWPDGEGLFPWQSGVAQGFADSQPDLSEEGWRASLRD